MKIPQTVSTSNGAIMPLQREIVIIESPFAGDSERNLLYLKRALRDSWDRGECPFASHGFFPTFLDENNPEERSVGIAAGYQFWKIARRIVFYIDYNWSPGMAAACTRACAQAFEIHLRTIGKNPK
jgi:hypothetical protein